MTTKYNRLMLSLESSESSDYSSNVLRNLFPFIDTFTGDAYPTAINFEASSSGTTIDTGLLGSIDYTIVFNRSTITSIDVTINDADVQSVITLQPGKMLVFPTTSVATDITIATTDLNTAECTIVLIGSYP